MLRLFCYFDIVNKGEFMDAKPYFKVIIAGGRDFANYELLKTKCDYYLKDISKTHQIIVVSGAAKGADKLGERYAQERGYAIDSHVADWDQFGKRAGYIRNEEMAKCSQALIAYYDGQSKGTGHMIDLAKKYNIVIRVVSY